MPTIENCITERETLGSVSLKSILSTVSISGDRSVYRWWDISAIIGLNSTVKGSSTPTHD